MKNIDIKKLIVLIILGLCSIGASVFILYGLSLLSGIENFIRILFSITIVLITLILCLSFIKSFRKKKSKYLLYIPFVFIYCFILIIFGYYIIKTYKAIDKLTTSDTTYSSSLVSLAANKSTSLDNLKSGKIGMVDDENNVIGYQVPKEIINENKIKNEIVEYESYIDIINALYDEEIEYGFLPTNYAIMFETMEEIDFSTIRDDTKIIYTKDKTVQNETASSKSTLDKPFTILLMGVDSENESISGSSFNGDSLILITFNPNTLSSTILSIPRDSYVPIMCFAGHKRNKITHAAWYGESCMMSTIENFTGIPIDYFVKINFKGVVKLVDTLGGVEVDVPYAFCEQNSNRQFGEHTLYIDKGFQTLNGEQALAFARNRHTWPHICGPYYSNYVSNDFVRGQNQQNVIRALLNKFKEINSLDTVYSLLDAIGTSMQTNMTTSEILSLYNITKDILVKNSGQNMDELLSIQRLYLSGYDKYIYDSASKLSLYNYVLYTGSINDVSNAMKINLGLTQPTMVKQFAFSIDEPYEEVVIGKGYYTTSSADVDGTLPDFVGDTEQQARTTARRIGVSVSFEYKAVKNGDNTVISQNYPENTKLSTISKLILTIGTPKVDSEEDEDEKNDTVTLPYLTNKTVSDAMEICNDLGLTLKVRDINYKEDDVIISQEFVGKVKKGSIVYVKVKTTTSGGTNSSNTTDKDNNTSSNSGTSTPDKDNNTSSNNGTFAPDKDNNSVEKNESSTTEKDDSNSSNNNQDSSSSNTTSDKNDTTSTNSSNIKDESVESNEKTEEE